MYVRLTLLSTSYFLTYLCLLAGCEYRDVGILVDSSGSIVEDPTVDSYDQLQRFVKLIIGRIDVGPSQNLIGLVQYSETVETIFNFSRYANDSKADIYKSIDGMAPLRDNTNTALGLR